MGLSIRAYARHRGVSHVAVKKAIDSGRITPEADGTLDPARADAEWARNTVPVRQAAKVGTAVKPAAAESPRARPQESPEAAAPALSTGGASLLQARTVNEVVKAQTNKLRLAQLKGELVDRAQAIAHVFKLARAERDAWLNWPNRITPILAAELGIDEHTLFVALDVAVRVHLEELGEFVPKVDG
jgi:hypothetical protein